MSIISFRLERVMSRRRPSATPSSKTASAAPVPPHDRAGYAPRLLIGRRRLNPLALPGGHRTPRPGERGDSALLRLEDGPLEPLAVGLVTVELGEGTGVFPAVGGEQADAARAYPSAAIAREIRALAALTVKCCSRKPSSASADSGVRS